MTRNRSHFVRTRPVDSGLTPKNSRARFYPQLGILEERTLLSGYAFSDPVTYLQGQSFGTEITGDFNGDGKPDLAALGTDGVTILLNDGHGSAHATGTFGKGTNPFTAVVGDFNGDGKADLVMAGSAGVNILLGIGDGTFQSPINVTADSGSTSLVAGDFNKDGKLDLAFTNRGNGGDGLPGPVIDGTVTILLGNGDGTFKAGVNYTTGPGSDSIITGDFNGDGRLDLAVANAGFDSGNTFIPGNLAVLMGNGDGTFKAPQIYDASATTNAGASPSSVVMADFNGDGHPDLAVGSSIQVGVLLNNGDGTFQGPINDALIRAENMAVADFNGDGKPDLLISPLEVDRVSTFVLLGNGNGTFQAPVNVDMSAQGLPAVADFNGDGKPDLALGEPYGVSVLLNQGFLFVAPTFVIHADHSLWEHTDPNTSSQLLAGVQAVSAGPGNGVFAILANGSLEQQELFGWGQLAAPGLVLAISAGEDSFGQTVVYGVRTDHSLWQSSGGFWLPLTGSGKVLSVSAGPAGTVFAIGTDRSLWGHDTAGWHQLASAGLVLSMSAGSDGSGQPVVDAIGMDQSLWQRDNTRWHPLAGAGLVQSVSAGPADIVFATGLNNSLWAHAASGWTELNPNGTPAGPVLILDASTDNRGRPVVFAIAQDESLWEDTISGWIQWAAAGTAIGISAVP